MKGLITIFAVYCVLLKTAFDMRTDSQHRWARTPRILMSMGVGGRGWVYYIKFVRYYNGIRRRGGGGVITLTPCVPRYALYTGHAWSYKRFFSKTHRQKKTQLEEYLFGPVSGSPVGTTDCTYMKKKPRHTYVLSAVPYHIMRSPIVTPGRSILLRTLGETTVCHPNKILHFPILSPHLFLVLKKGFFFF